MHVIALSEMMDGTEGFEMGTLSSFGSFGLGAFRATVVVVLFAHAGAAVALSITSATAPAMNPTQSRPKSAARPIFPPRFATGPSPPFANEATQFRATRLHLGARGRRPLQLAAR